MNSAGSSNVLPGGLGRINAAANVNDNQPERQFSNSLVSGIRYSVGPSVDSSEKNIRLKEGENRITDLFARVIDPCDIGVGDIDNELKNTVLHRGFVDECKYVPLKLDVVESGQTKTQVFLVRVEDVRESMVEFSDLPDLRDNSILAPFSLVDFVEKHCASDEDVEAAVSARYKRQSEKAAEHATTKLPLDHSRKSVFDQLLDEALACTIKVLNLADQDVKDIAYIAKNYKRSEQYLRFVEKQKSTPDSSQFYAYHIRAGSPVTIQGNVYFTPLSLLVNPAAPEGSLDVEVLLKGKIQGYDLRASGTDKSIKTTLDIATGRIRVQCTFNVGNQAKRLLGFIDNDGRLLKENQLSSENVANLRKKENELITRCMKEADLQHEFSGIETEKTAKYAAKATRSSQISVRENERKLICTGGELLLTYTMEEAKGDLADEYLRKMKILGSTNVQGISQSFYNCLINTAMTVEKLHASDRVHRDLKRENLLFFSKNNEDGVKVGDYGFSIEVHANGTIKGTEGLCGTLVYTDPETSVVRYRMESHFAQIFRDDDYKTNSRRAKEGLKNLDLKKGDVYGLGCTYYAILMSKGKNDDLTALTPFGKEVLEVNSVLAECQNRRKQKTFVKADGDNLIKSIEGLQDLAKTVPLAEEARNNLMKVCPPAVAELITSMLHPDQKARPDMKQVVAGIRGFVGLVQ